MKLFLKKPGICFVLAGVMVTPAQLALSSDAGELDLLSSALGIAVSNQALSVSQVPLGPEFRATFPTKRSLTHDRVRDHFMRFPGELLAFRRYIQSLHDRGYLTYEESSELIKHAVNGLAKKYPPGSDRSTNYRISSPVETETNNRLTKDSPKEIAIRESVESVNQRSASADHPPAAIYEFGEDIERAQNQAAVADARRAVAELQAAEERRRLEAQAAYLMQELARSGKPKQTLLERVNSILNKHTEQVAQKQAEALFDNSEVAVSSSNGETRVNARVLKSLNESSDSPLVNYAELGLVTEDGRQTLNLGHGIRILDPTQTVMYGANLFFDQEWPHDHQRASVGLEMITSPLRLSANRYFALSGAKQTNLNNIETALSGHDINAKLAVPYLPYLFVDYSKFKWNGSGGMDDIKGQTIGLSGALSDSLSLEVARKIYGNNDLSSQNSAQLTYRYTPNTERRGYATYLSSVPYSLEKLSPHQRHAMTTRENQIQKQLSRQGVVMLIGAE